MTSAAFTTRGYERTPRPLHGVVWLVLFAAMVSLLGGSSRFDAVQLAALRPLSALFLIPALYWMSRDKLVDARAPVAILMLTGMWTALQLVPLPPALWQALPGRDLIADLDAIHAIRDTWRPISWVPMRGWNALFALIVPFSAVLLALAVRPTKRALLLIIVAIGVVDALAGLTQIVSGSESVLYLYTHTNRGGPVGLFANENHSGVFSAIVLLVIARLAFGRGRARRIESIALAVAFLLVSLALLVSGSRAALGGGIGAWLACAVIAWFGLRRPSLDLDARGPAAWLARHPRLVLAAGVAALAGFLLALFQFDRAPGLVDALNQNAFEDLRWQIAPILREMIATNWLVGTGFGTFDALYLIYEPTAFQGPNYVNQAHNDWAQFIIEGGLPGIVLLIALASWLYTALRRVYARDALALAKCVFWSAIIGVIAVASLVDYPLRTPLFQVVCAYLVVALAFDVRSADVRAPR